MTTNADVRYKRRILGFQDHLQQLPESSVRPSVGTWEQYRIMKSNICR